MAFPVAVKTCALEFARLLLVISRWTKSLFLSVPEVKRCLLLSFHQLFYWNNRLIKCPISSTGSPCLPAMLR